MLCVVGTHSLQLPSFMFVGYSLHYTKDGYEAFMPKWREELKANKIIRCPNFEILVSGTVSIEMASVNIYLSNSKCY